MDYLLRAVGIGNSMDQVCFLNADLPQPEGFKLSGEDLDPPATAL
ncbi:MAG TPA: hypothetical protein VJB38_10620 [Bacteroidota bacterium]|nr:hypothetical protein [Bacteroidota bacterium]